MKDYVIGNYFQNGMRFLQTLHTVLTKSPSHVRFFYIHYLLFILFVCNEVAALSLRGLCFELSFQIKKKMK